MINPFLHCMRGLLAALGRRASGSVTMSRLELPISPSESPGAQPDSLSAREHDADRHDRYLALRVRAGFDVPFYARTFAALQAAPGAKVLDLSAARRLSLELFDRLASAWVVPCDRVGKLAIVVSFEHWVLLRASAVEALRPIAALGTAVELFYEEQAWGGQIRTWLTTGAFVHNVGAAIATLTMNWRPSPSWPLVIDALTHLVRISLGADAIPIQLVEIAGLALSCGSTVSPDPDPADAAAGRWHVSAERPGVVDDSFRQLVRETVRQVLREELAPLTRRNGVAQPTADDGYLSVAKAARLADVAPGTIRAWIRAGQLTAQHAGRVLRISRSELTQFMAGAPTGPNGAETERRAAHLFGLGGTLRSRAT